MNKNEILVTGGDDMKAMTRNLIQTAALADMILKRCKRRDARIMVKPNLLGPIPADEGATTHPQIVEEIIRYLQENRFTDISVCEGSWVGDRTEDSLLVTGFGEMCSRLGVPFIDLQKDSAERVDSAGLELSVCSVPLHADYLINVPVMKGHCQTKMTCALKNMKGCIPNPEKRRFHRMGLHRPIGHLNAGIRQDFILTDAFCPDLTFEDGGNPVPLHRLFCSADPVLNDAYACRLMNIPAGDVPYIRIAQDCGVGSMDLSRACIMDLGGGDGRQEEVLRQRQVPVDVSEVVSEVDSCSACYGTLVPVLRKLHDEGLIDRFPDRICIGQGFRGKRGKIGIGSCTSAFDRYLPGCPPSEQEMEQFLRKIIRKQS